MTDTTDVQGEDRPPGPHPLETLFDELVAAADGRSITLGTILDALERRSFGPLLLLPSLISVMPVIGMLPGVTWAMSALTLLISLHFLANSKKLWLPQRIRRQEIPACGFRRGVEWARPWLRRVDSVVEPRLHLLFSWPWTTGFAALCVLMSLGMFAASVVPGGVVVPALGIIIMAAGLTARDGLVLALGGIASAGALWAVWLIVGAV
ncbi:exopolysaccharide biosynthesis protein [Maricaulis sp.]|uniref:exopolysaccharide biosynthesis protein n=1 Tax=Maricaulis sp. TaxID=1486257 RepID=UPI00260C6593|nr:exopolysaccharide biosynthesis protein [Maricaulis sp.]